MWKVQKLGGVPGGTRSTHVVTTIPQEVSASLTAKIKDGLIDEAIDETVGYIKAVATSPQHKSQLQEQFDKFGMSCGSYDFCDGLANSDDLKQFKPDNTPALFQPHDSNQSLQVRADHSNSTLHEVNFNRTDIREVVVPEFMSVTSEAKLAIRRTAHLSGAVLTDKGIYAGGCFRVSVDLVIVPLHCACNIMQGSIRFLTPDLQSTINCHIAEVVEVYENLDLAVVKLREQQEAVSITYGDTVLDGEQLFLLHNPGGEGLHVSGNVCRLSATWNGYSLVTAHDTSPGSSGGIYINKHGHVVGIHIGVNRRFEAISGVERYALRFAGVVLGVDADSHVYSCLDLEAPKKMKQVVSDIVTLNDGNTVTMPVIDATQMASQRVLLRTIAQVLRGFYNGQHTREYCRVIVDKVCTLSVVTDEVITLSFAVVVKASDKYLAGVDVFATDSAGKTVAHIQIGNKLQGYQQVLRIEYPHEEKKWLWINTNVFSAERLDALVSGLWNDRNNPDSVQNFFDYLIQILEIAKFPVVEALTHKVVEYEQQHGVTMIMVINAADVYGADAHLFRQLTFIFARVKLNHSKLSKLFPNTLSVDQMIEALKKELDNTRSTVDFIFEFIVPVLKVLNLIQDAQYDQLLEQRHTSTEGDLLKLCAQHETSIRGLFTPSIQ